MKAKELDENFENLSNQCLNDLDRLFQQAFGIRGHNFMAFNDVPAMIMDIVQNYMVILRDEYKIEKIGNEQ